MSWSWKAAPQQSPSPPSLLRTPRPRSPTPYSDTRVPRPLDRKPLPLTFGSGGRFESLTRTRPAVEHSTFFERPQFITPETQNTTPNMTEQQPTMGDIMSLLQELHDSNTTLRHEALEQAQRIQELQAATPANPTPAPTNPTAHSPMQPNKPAEFGGSKDECIETWLFQVEQYVALTNISHDTRAFFAASFFRGAAALWWRSFASSLRDPDRPDILVCQWPAFRQACLAQFRPVNAARVAREKLMVLTQSTSVANYAHRFRTLLLNIPDLSEADRLFLFTRGLKRDVAAMVQLSSPTSWETAAITAENIDSVLFEG